MSEFVLYDLLKGNAKSRLMKRYKQLPPGDL